MAKTWGIAATLLGAWVAVIAYGAGPPSSDGTAAVPAPITRIGELGKEIYDLANHNEWTKLFDRLDSLNKATDTLDAEVKDEEKAKQRLFRSITDLEESADARDPLGAMQAANQITLVAANLAEPFHPKTPVDIARLDYYGRELQIWSQDKNEAKLVETADALQKTWISVRPVVLSHGGAVERFDALVQKLKEAKSSDQYSSIVTPLLSEVDSLEKLFTK